LGIMTRHLALGEISFSIGPDEIQKRVRVRFL
jgi:hypothetical protein